MKTCGAGALPSFISPELEVSSHSPPHSPIPLVLKAANALGHWCSA